MPEERKPFMKPSKSFYESFKAYNVRGLLPVTGITREQFWQEANGMVTDAVAIAREAGADEREQEHVRLEAIRRLAESSLFYFCVVVLNLYFINNDYGYRLCLDVQYNKWRKLWVIAREFFKSTIITEASTLWEIINDPNQTYCIYSYKTDMAMKFLNVIKSWIENNALIRKLWPHIFWENPAMGYEDTEYGRRRWAWTSEQIEVKRTIESKEKTIEVAGVMGSSKTGAHFSRQIFDDTETQKNVETPDAIEKLLMQTLMAFNTGQTEHLEYCFVGTFYARADVYYRMIDGAMKWSPMIEGAACRYPSVHFRRISPSRVELEIDSSRLDASIRWDLPQQDIVYRLQRLCGVLYRLDGIRISIPKKLSPSAQIPLTALVDSLTMKRREYDKAIEWETSDDGRMTILLDLLPPEEEVDIIDKLLRQAKAKQEELNEK